MIGPRSPGQGRLSRLNGDQINFFDLIQQFKLGNSIFNTNMFGWGDGLEAPDDPSTLTNTGIRLRDGSNDSSNSTASALAAIPAPLFSNSSVESSSPAESAGQDAGSSAPPASPISPSPALQALDDVLNRWKTKEPRSFLAQGKDSDAG
ncbi:MAG: hypothetical protein ABS79_05375 [Planctomycetes bacterium SCN 63-9]|nr:MAG: hypothetical protein ABS79_05375 [Planctomycetes bacterium SCN 63-9]